MIPTQPPAANALCLASSSGGHLRLLEAVRDVFAPRRRFWVTTASSQAEALVGEGEEVLLVPHYNRDLRAPLDAALNSLAAIRIVARRRPRLVVTNGAGVVVPLALAARLAGGELIYIETMARVTEPSLTGRILAHFARTVIVQWPEALSAYPGARLCRPALLERIRSEPVSAGAGTFVAVGTRPEQFDRLLAIVDRAVAAGVLPGPVVAQSGFSSYTPANYSTIPWIAPSEVDRAARESRLVVCHGGSGTISAALAAGRRPLVLPRLVSRGEHRTQHQQQLVAKLASLGLVVPLSDEIGQAEIEAAAEPLRPPVEDSQAPSLEAVLAEELEAVLGPAQS